MNQAITLLQNAIELISSHAERPKIGIGITTRNRYETFKKSYAEIVRLSPGCKVVVVDDASNAPVPNATFRFNTNVGIAAAKNKCFELLDDCEHIFLFDDDTYPLKENWFETYINSGHAHLMYIFQDFSTGRKLNDNVLLYKDSVINAWSHPRGCMLYFRRECIERVGGMNTIFGKWGWEHVNLSDRIYHAGLNQFKYADVSNSKGLFFSGDETETVQSTVLGSERSIQIQKNKAIYESLNGTSDFIPYKTKTDILLTSYFTGVPDTQRAGKWQASMDELQPLIQSLKGFKLVVLHDCFDGLQMYPNVEFVKVDTSVNPYFQRWISYRQYLQTNKDSIANVFCIDATDVELLKDPFQSLTPDRLYLGDEVEVLGCQWMLNHHKNPALLEFFKMNANMQLLNAGIAGGSIDILLDFIHKVIDYYFSVKTDSTLRGISDCGDTDMGAFNYVARTYFNDKIIHGSQINTRFKADEKTHPIAWFKHK
jgi:hypothetical protein